MPRKAQPRTTLPSGIQQSANGKYFYWKCNVSGLETFADENRFKDVVVKYGSEENLYKTYVLRPVQKYVDAGFDSETIKLIVKKNGGKLPALDASTKIKVAGLPRKGSKNAVETVSVGSEEIVAEPIKIYPWTGNPDFFKSAASPISVSDTTKEVCLYPNRHLDNECRGCSIYVECACSSKFTDEDWRKPSKRNEVKITPIKAFDS